MQLGPGIWSLTVIVTFGGIVNVWIYTPLKYLLIKLGFSRWLSCSP